MGTSGTVTILFTDLVGSTALLSQLGEQAAEELRQRHFSLLRQAVREARGDEVKNLGDGLMVAFQSVSGGVGCAVAMQQNVERHNRRSAGPGLGLRVGVSVGEADSEGGDFFGTPVIEAARLCAKAHGGQILTTEVVRILTGRRGDHDFASLGAIELKGLTDPLPTCVVHWTPLAGGLGLPPQVEAEHPVRFVGRDHEREVLDVAMKDAAGGRRRAVLVAGDPGIGKTRLATETARLAHRAGATVLFGRCDEEVVVPYQPFAEAIRHLVAVCSDDDMATWVDEMGSALARLVPEIAARLPNLASPRPAEPDTERFLLFEAITTLLANASQTAPVMLILDDLQWAAKPTLLLLKHLLGSPTPMAVLIVATYRDSDIGRSHVLTDVLADLRRIEGVERIVLQGLSDAEVVEFVETAAAQDLDQDGVALAHALHHETEGSPFFVGETLRHLVETGALFEKDGRWAYSGSIVDLAIPDSVREVIGRRLNRLAPATNRILGFGAVIGREFDVAVLAQAADVPLDECLDAVDEAAEARLTAEVSNRPGRYGFTHALIRHTLYDELSGARRLRMHQRVADAFETLAGPDPARYLSELAFHWSAATPTASILPDQVAKARHYAEMAAKHATEVFAFEEAVGHYWRVLAILEPGPTETAERAALLVEMGDAQWRAGDTVAAKKSFAEAAALARDAGQPETFARAALGYGMGLGGAGFSDRIDAALVSLLEATLGFLSDIDSVLRVRILARLATELYFTDDVERRAKLGDEAVFMARRLGDPVAQLIALYSQQWAALGPDGVEERLAAGEEIVRLAEEIDDREMAYRGHHLRICSQLTLGRMEEVAQEIEICNRIALELRQPLYAWQTAIYRAMEALHAGRLEEGEALAIAAADVGAHGPTVLAMTLFTAQLGYHRYCVGRFDEVIPAVQHMVDDLPIEAVWLGVLAFLYSETGRHEEATLLLDALVANGCERVPRNGYWLMTLSFLGWACWGIGDRAKSRVVYEQLAPYADRIAVSANPSVTWGSVASVLAVLAATEGAWDKADAYFDQARHLLDATGSVVWTVLTERAWIQALRGRGGPSDLTAAAALVSPTADLADEVGMHWIADQLRQLP